jgi:hypothetical protein
MGNLNHKMKFVKFLLVLILMGLSFIIGAKFDGMKRKENSDVFADSVDIIDSKETQSTIGNVGIEVKKEGEIDSVIIEEIVLPEGDGIAPEQVGPVNLDNVENAENITNPSPVEDGTAVPESLQEGEVPTTTTTNSL